MIYKAFDAQTQTFNSGQLLMYQTMYEKAMDESLKCNLFRPITSESKDILISGSIHVRERGGEVQYELETQGQHLVYFLGGLMTLEGRLFGRMQDVEAGLSLVNGCVYIYSAFPHGIMSKTFDLIACNSAETCEWDESLWKEEVRNQADGNQGEDVSVETIVFDSRD